MTREERERLAEIIETAGMISVAQTLADHIIAALGEHSLAADSIRRVIGDLEHTRKLIAGA